MFVHAFLQNKNMHVYIHCTCIFNVSDYTYVHVHVLHMHIIVLTLGFGSVCFCVCPVASCRGILKSSNRACMCSNFISLPGAPLSWLTIIINVNMYKWLYLTYTSTNSTLCNIHWYTYVRTCSSFVQKYKIKNTILNSIYRANNIMTLCITW